MWYTPAASQKPSFETRAFNMFAYGIMSILFVFAWVFRMFAYQMLNLQWHSRCLPTIYSLHLEFYMFLHSIINMFFIYIVFQDVCAWNICCIYRGILYVAYKIYIAFTSAFWMFAYTVMSILFPFTWFFWMFAYEIFVFYRGILHVCLQYIHCICKGILHDCLQYHEYIIGIIMFFQEIGA